MANEFSLCPLFPFESDCAELNLIGGIHIKPASESFQSLLTDNYLIGNNFWDVAFRARTAWVAELPFLDRTIEEIEKVIQTQKFTAEEILADMLAVKTNMMAYCFVTALRLFREGLVTPGPITMPSPEGDKPIWISPDWIKISSEDYLFEEPNKYVLTQADVPEVNNIFLDVLKWFMSKEYPFIKIALNRFHSSYSGEPEEKLIDQIIAFEAIYLGNTNNQRKKLSDRTAHFIGKSQKEQDNIYNDMFEAYSLRNAIMHGDDELNVDSIKTVLPRTENYLRRSIRKMLSLLPDVPKSRKERQQWLDDKIPS